MELAAQASSIGFPLLRKLSLFSQMGLAGWFLLNGTGHQLHVLWKAHHGTLKEGANTTSLLLVGAGLLAIGAAASFAVSLVRSGGVSGFLAQTGVVALAAAVIAGIWYVYGTMFLTGSIAITAVSLVILLADAILNGMKTAA